MMKKLLALTLILALLIPALALASGPEGCWVSYDPLTTGAPHVSFLFLAENGTCYFLTQMFNEDSAGFGRTFVGTWELQEDGSVVAKTGNNTSTTLTFHGEKLAIDDLLTVWVNITEFTLKE